MGHTSFVHLYTSELLILQALQPGSEKMKRRKIEHEDTDEEELDESDCDSEKEIQKDSHKCKAINFLLQYPANL